MPPFAAKGGCCLLVENSSSSARPISFVLFGKLDYHQFVYAPPIHIYDLKS
jgi:hypothetical protein